MTDLKIAILECDPCSSEVWQEYGKFHQLFEQSLGEINKNLKFQNFEVFNHQFPNNINDFDGFIISGSQYGAYEKRDWILELETFIQKLFVAKKKTAGICFGHQIMAKALGGTVEKSNKSWGVGIMKHQIIDPEKWMGVDKGEQIYSIVSHQDQVIELPKNARVNAGNDFCPYYWLSYENHFTSLQGHPEFSKEISRTLMKKKEGLTQEQIKNGLESLNQQVDSKKINQWLINFLTSE